MAASPNVKMQAPPGVLRAHDDQGRSYSADSNGQVNIPADKASDLLKQGWTIVSATTGATASRPTTGLFAGYVHLDTTLGKPVFVKSLNPTVWVDATGSVV